MAEIPDLMRRAAATAVPVVRGVKTDQLAGRTPCAEYDVRALLNHLFHIVVSFQALARREPADMRTVPDYLTGDWLARFEAETGALIEAWSDPAALDGVSAGMGLPQPVIAQLAILDLTVHSWDLARATGQPHHPDPEVVETLLPTVTGMAPTARTRGVFGEPVEVAPDAPAFTRLLGLSGRDPDWQPQR